MFARAHVVRGGISQSRVALATRFPFGSFAFNARSFYLVSRRTTRRSFVSRRIEAARVAPPRASESPSACPLEGVSGIRSRSRLPEKRTRAPGKRKRDGGRDTNEESERKKPARSLSAGREIDCSGPLVVSVSPVLLVAGVLTVKILCAVDGSLASDFKRATGERERDGVRPARNAMIILLSLEYRYAVAPDYVVVAAVSRA